MDNYKKCPFKKRPIIMHERKEEPEDLSFKTSPKKSIFMEHKRHFDLSSNSYYDCLRKTNEFGFWYNTFAENIKAEQFPISSIANDLNIQTGLNDYQNPLLSQQFDGLTNIHLRGLTNLELSNFNYDSYWSSLKTTNSLQNGFNLLQKEYDSCYSTPPSSPSSLITITEPEDLTIQSGGKFTIESILFNPKKRRCLPQKTTKLLKSKISAAARTQQQLNYRYQCEKCHKSYSTSTGLSKHQQLHCPAAECNQIKKEFNCKNCTKVYTSLGALKMHIRTHTLPCKCQHCGKAFSRPWLLQGHIRTHTGEKPFSCNHCQRSFADRSNLRAHQQTHVDVKKYICVNCSKSFSRMSLLSKHNAGGCGIPYSNLYISENS